MAGLKKRKRTKAEHSAQAREAGKLGGRPRHKRYLELYNDVGEPPPDLLDQIGWHIGLLTRASQRLIRDTQITDDVREAGLRQNARAVGALLPKSRLRKAEKLIRGEQERIARPAKDPTLEPASKKKPKPAPVPARPDPQLEPATTAKKGTDESAG